MKVQSLKNSSQNSLLKILLFGQSGEGKTFMASTVPVKTLLIGAENGELSLRGSDVDFIDLTKDDAGKNIPENLRLKRLGEIYDFLLTPEAIKTYQCIYIDSLSEIAQFVLDDLKKEYPDKKDALKMFGENLDIIKNIVKLFRDLPYYHVVLTSLAKIDKDENGKRFIAPDVSGKMSSMLPAFFDEVFYLSTIENQDGRLQKVVQCHPSDRVKCKDRSGKLDPYEPADFTHIFNKILK
jgi:hypothetical protein